MASWIWGSSNPQFDELVGASSPSFPARPALTLPAEKACSPLNLPYPESQDIALELEICDLIRSKTVPARQAMLALKSRIASKNPRVQLAALGLTDVCIKNGGDHFLQQVASKEFVDELVGVVKSPAGNPQVRDTARRLLQAWAMAFESKRELGLLPETYRQLKNEGESRSSSATRRSSNFPRPRNRVPPSANQHPVPPPDDRHATHMDRLGLMHALPDPLLIHKPQTPLSRLRPRL